MTANECIRGRRSIRRFTDQPVSHELAAGFRGEQEIPGCGKVWCLLFPDAHHRRQPVQPGHHHVHEDQPQVGIDRPVQRLHAVVGPEDPVPLLVFFTLPA